MWQLCLLHSPTGSLCRFLCSIAVATPDFLKKMNFFRNHTLQYSEIIHFKVIWLLMTKSCLVSLFSDISTFGGIFNAESILVEEQQWYILTYSWGHKGFMPFPKILVQKSTYWYYPIIMTSKLFYNWIFILNTFHFETVKLWLVHCKECFVH